MNETIAKINEVIATLQADLAKAFAQLKKDGAIVSPIRCKWQPAYHDIYSASILCCSSHWLTVSSSTWVNTYLPRKASGAHSFEKTDP